MRVTGYAFIISCCTVIVAAQNADRFSYQVVAGSGFVDGTGKIVIPPKYTQVREFHEGVAAVMRDGKWGYVDSAGIEVVAPIYRGAEDFSEGVGLVMDDAGHTGSVDHQWHMKILDCIPLASDDISSYVPPPFSEGLTEFQSGSDTVYVDHACNKVIVQPGGGEPFADGLAAVRIGQKSGYIDHTGKMVIPMQFTFGCRFHEGMACVDISGGRGYIDRAGKLVIQPQFGPKSQDFSEGIAAVQIEDKIGYIDKSGKIVIPAQFDEAHNFSEGLAQVRNQTTAKATGGARDIRSATEDIFFIDHSGKPAITTHFEYAFGESFKAGLVYMKEHGRGGFSKPSGSYRVASLKYSSGKTIGLEVFFVSEWLSPSLEFGLLALKIIGLLGAFLGLSREAEGGGKPKRRAPVVAFCFLLVAIGAELCDSMLKRLDSREQATRFERLAHPLGTITVTPLYSLALADSSLAAYKARLDKTGDAQIPDPDKEPEAYALFNSWPDIFIFLDRADHSKEKSPEGEPDLSFEVSIKGSDSTAHVPKSAGANIENDIAIARHYTYGQAAIHAQLAASSNTPDDRYSNGSIISVADLPGARLEIRLCPMIFTPNGDLAVEARLAQQMKLETLYIDFPGKQEFAITPLDTKTVQTVAPGGSDRCWSYIYSFPSSLAEFNKAKVP